MKPVIIETDRTFMRPFVPGDAPALGVAMRDANVTETTMFEAPARTSEEGEARARARINDFSDHWRRHGFGIFAAVGRDPGSFIGYCGMRHLDEFGGDVNISTMVDRPFWARGIASEIFRRNLSHAFLELRLDVVYGAARLFTGASVRLMEANGFVRQEDRILRNWRVCYYACQREAFMARQAANLKAGPRRAPEPVTGNRLGNGPAFAASGDGKF